MSILNEYVHNNRISKHRKQKLKELRGEICKLTIIVEDNSISLSIIQIAGKNQQGHRITAL